MIWLILSNIQIPNAQWLCCHLTISIAPPGISSPSCMLNLPFLIFSNLPTTLFLENILNLSGVINFWTLLLCPYLHKVLPYRYCTSSLVLLWCHLCLVKFQLISLICFTILFRIGHSQGNLPRHGSKNLLTPAAGNLPSIRPLFLLFIF